MAKTRAARIVELEATVTQQTETVRFLLWRIQEMKAEYQAALAAASGSDDPYADLPEIVVDFGDDRSVRIKATEDDVRTLMSEFEKASAKKVESLSERLERAKLKLAEARLAARQCEGFEPELRYLFSTDPAIRTRVREMVAARTKAV